MSMNPARFDDDEGNDQTDHGRSTDAVAPTDILAPLAATEQSVFSVRSEMHANDRSDPVPPQVRNSLRQKPILTRREKQVLESIANGNTALGASKILGVSATTVQTHLRNAQVKLQTIDSLHTVVEAIRRSEIAV